MTRVQAVKSDPEIMSGALCFTGTRVPVQNLFDYLEGGGTIDTFLETFDWVKRDQVMTVLELSAELIGATSHDSLTN